MQHSKYLSRLQIWNAHMGEKIQMLHYKSEPVANVANSDI